MPSSKPRIVVIGYGMAGRIIHAPLIQACPDLELAGIVSTRPDAVHADWPGMTVIPDIDTTLEDPTIDAVVIATPNEHHGGQAIAALNAGKHVVIDKPFATSFSQAIAIADAARANNRLVQAFQNRRWDTHILTARHLLQKKSFGDISDVTLRYDRLRAIVPGRWSDEDRPGSGLWFNLGSHVADQAVHLFGTPRTVYADFQAQRPGAKTIDYFNVILGYGRFRVVLHSCVISPAPGPVIEIQGPAGAFVKWGEDSQEDGLKVRAVPGGPGWGADTNPGIFTPADGETRGTPQTADSVPGDYPAFYSGLAAAIATGAPPPVPLDETLTVMKLLDLAIESAATGRRLDLNP
ncbi:Gfo/Idh/MocA family oxidoreductase [Asticcacaulis solisilvae]|uniref:Gfo/Idh/MocA family oxidoreductase n=1 Tax=Asticcacaulis solisilvae TaxID=1217274 RepID=UPI003FD83733